MACYEDTQEQTNVGVKVAYLPYCRLPIINENQFGMNAFHSNRLPKLIVCLRNDQK